MCELDKNYFQINAGIRWMSVYWRQLKISIEISSIKSAQRKAISITGLYASNLNKQYIFFKCVIRCIVTHQWSIGGCVVHVAGDGRFRRATVHVFEHLGHFGLWYAAAVVCDANAQVLGTLHNQSLNFRIRSGCLAMIFNDRPHGILILKQFSIKYCVLKNKSKRKKWILCIIQKPYGTSGPAHTSAWFSHYFPFEFLECIKHILFSLNNIISNLLDI